MTQINHRVNEALLRAKNLIRDPKHWIKGASQEQSFDPETGEYVTAYCATGALSAIGFQLGLTSDEIAEVKKSLAAALDEEWSDPEPGAYADVANDHIVTINDREGTTHDQIVAAFDKALRQRREAARA